MKPLRIDHLGIAVPSLEAAVAAYEVLGFRVEARHDVPTDARPSCPSASRSSSSWSRPTPPP